MEVSLWTLRCKHIHCTKMLSCTHLITDLHVYMHLSMGFIHLSIKVRVCYEINTMPNFLSLLMLTIIMGVTCHPIQRRQTEDYRCRVITNVCTVLWHIQDTMEHCPAGSACNSTAMGIIHSVIRTDFSAWVRWPFDENSMRSLIVMCFDSKGACQSCTSSVTSSTYYCSSITVEEIRSTTYSQLL